MKVLVVDDDTVNRGVLVHALKHLYETTAARDGREALRLIHEAPPDLVLLDVMMPDLDGYEVCRLMRADPRMADIAVVFVTAIDSPEGERLGLELGANDYLTKPLDLRLAKLRVRNQLEIVRQAREIRAQNALLSEQKRALEASLARVRRLEGVLCMCMDCRKIRTERAAWQHVEAYLADHTDVRFSHGLCEPCLAIRLEQTAELEPGER